MNATAFLSTALLFVLCQDLNGLTPVLAAFAANSTTKWAAPPIAGEADEGEIGIAMAGGSLRAFSACYGALRGFQQKRVTGSNGKEMSAMDLVKYNSGISGGSVPAILYSYTQVGTDELLETSRTTDPSKITIDDLAKMPKTSMGYVIARKPGARKMFVLASLKVLSKPWNIFKIHSLWTAAVHKKFFEPLKVPKNKFFTSSREELEKILHDNPKLKEDDFLLPRDGTKALPMILTSMHGSRADLNQYEDNYRAIYKYTYEEYKAQLTLASYTKSAEKPSMTRVLASIREKHGSNMPMPYVMTPDCVENKYSGLVDIRNEKIQFPEKNSKPFEWGSKKGKYGRKSRFSVEFLASMSTNFVGSAMSTPSLFATGLRKLDLSDDFVTTQRFADGGTNDLMGIMPLVARGTKNIISVYNFNQNPPYTGFAETYADIYRNANATSLDDPNFDSHFREWLKYINPRITGLFGFYLKPINHANIMNHVFEDPNIDRLKELMIKYNSLFKAGEPLIATLKDLEVIDNPFWSVKGGKEINLTLMWFNMPKKFSEKVSIGADTDDDGRFIDAPYRELPELPNVAPTDAIFYSNEQINMMGYLGSWMVDHSWDGLKGHNGEVVFEGFSKIFEKK